MIPSKLDALNVVNAKNSFNRPKRESISSIFAEIAIEKDLVGNIERLIYSEKASYVGNLPVLYAKV